MTMEVRWIASAAAASLYACQKLLAGAKLVDEAVADALADDTEGLADDLAAVGLEAEPFFEHAIPLSASLAAPTSWPGLPWLKPRALLGKRRRRGWQAELPRFMQRFAGPTRGPSKISSCAAARSPASGKPAGRG